VVRLAGEEKPDHPQQAVGGAGLEGAGRESLAVKAELPTVASGGCDAEPGRPETLFAGRASAATSLRKLRSAPFEPDLGGQSLSSSSSPDEQVGSIAISLDGAWLRGTVILRPKTESAEPTQSPAGTPSDKPVAAPALILHAEGEAVPERQVAVR
jgi:hypothetical protein